MEKHSQFHPLHLPETFPRRWQSNLHVDSAPQRANSEGVKRSVEHSHPYNNYKNYELVGTLSSIETYSVIVVANSVTSSNGMTSTLAKLQTQIASGR